MGQCQLGRLRGGFPLTDAVRTPSDIGAQLNAAFRFGVEQEAKLRECDDLKRDMVSLSCRFVAPIKLVSRGHLAELGRSTRDSADGWEFFKAGKKAAYKQLRLGPSGTSLAIIGLRGRGPSGGKR